MARSASRTGSHTPSSCVISCLLNAETFLDTLILMQMFIKIRGVGIILLRAVSVLFQPSKPREMRKKTLMYSSKVQECFIQFLCHSSGKQRKDLSSVLGTPRSIQAQYISYTHKPTDLSNGKDPSSTSVTGYVVISSHCEGKCVSG